MYELSVEELEQVVGGATIQMPHATQQGPQSVAKPNGTIEFPG